MEHPMDLQSAVGICRAAPPRSNANGELRRGTERILESYGAGSSAGRCAADRRIEAFLRTHFADLGMAKPLQLPGAIPLPSYGLSRELSLPRDRDLYRNEHVTSYRVRNGALHNPKS